MSPKKGAAKAVPAKKRARKAKAQAVAPKDWPPGLTEKKADDLFDLIASGDETVKTGSAKMGLKGQLVYQWRRRYPRFGALLDEAVDIGIDMAIDGYREIKAYDRDSAAGANIDIAVIDKYLARRRPERFHINPFKPAAGGGDGAALLGIVLVPMKVTQSQGDRPVIEGSAVRVPNKTLP